MNAVVAYLVMPDGEIVAVDGEIEHEEEIVEGIVDRETYYVIDGKLELAAIGEQLESEEVGDASADNMIEE